MPNATTSNAGSAFTIIFKDNGVGIDDSILQKGHRPGHFGLVGMQERARKLDGQILLDRGSEGGAEVTLVVPAAVAFKDSDRRLVRLWQGIRRIYRLPARQFMAKP